MWAMSPGSVPNAPRQSGGVRYDGSEFRSDCRSKHDRRAAHRLRPSTAVVGLGHGIRDERAPRQQPRGPTLTMPTKSALIPLIRLTGNREVMGENVDSPALRVAGWTSAFLIVTLNVVLLALTLGVGR